MNLKNILKTIKIVVLKSYKRISGVLARYSYQIKTGFKILIKVMIVLLFIRHNYAAHSIRQSYSPQSGVHIIANYNYDAAEPSYLEEKNFLKEFKPITGLDELQKFMVERKVRAATEKIDHIKDMIQFRELTIFQKYFSKPYIASTDPKKIQAFVDKWDVENDSPSNISNYIIGAKFRAKHKETKSELDFCLNKKLIKALEKSPLKKIDDIYYNVIAQLRELREKNWDS